MMRSHRDDSAKSGRAINVITILCTKAFVLVSVRYLQLCAGDFAIFVFVDFGDDFGESLFALFRTEFVECLRLVFA